MYSPLFSLIKGSHTKLTSSMSRTNSNLSQPKRVKRIGSNPKSNISTRAMANYRRQMQMASIEMPAARSSVVRPGTNRIYTDGNKVSVCNTEVLINSVSIAALGASTIASTALIPSILPWLQGVAQNYAQWKWKYLKLSYVPFCSTTTAGRFAMGLTYDSGDTTATTLGQVLQLDKAIMSPVWGGKGSIDVIVPIDKLFGNNYRYIGSTPFAALTSNTDRNIYCPVNVQFGTDSGVAGSVGTILVTYEIELFDPVVASMNP